MPVQIAVSATMPAYVQKAQLLADELALPFIQDALNAPGMDYVLLYTPTYLGLYKTQSKQFRPFYIDFTHGGLHYRAKQAGMRSEFIARAMGKKPNQNPVIVDATAGLGRDSFILARLGFQVTMLERSPILHALLQDALTRASLLPETAEVASRLTLVHIDANKWLTENSKNINIIYLDPMFPARQKSALVKKDMVMMHDVIGKDEDASELFQLALTCATDRVVVKRPRLAANISEKAPNFSLKGKSSRFDIYLT